MGFREFATVGLFSALVNAAGSAFVTALLLWIFGASAAGQYAMAERLIGMPIAILSAAVSQVFMGNLSGALVSRDAVAARSLFRRVLRVQIITGVPAIVLLYLLAPSALNLTSRPRLG